MPVTIDQKPITVNTKIIIAIVTATAISVTSFLNMQFQIKSDLNEIKSELRTSIKSLENENEIQDLKLQNIIYQVEKNKLEIEKLKDEGREKK